MDKFLTEALITVPLDPNEYTSFYEHLSTHERVEMVGWTHRQINALEAMLHGLTRSIGAA